MKKGQFIYKRTQKNKRPFIWRANEKTQKLEMLLMWKKYCYTKGAIKHNIKMHDNKSKFKGI